MEDEEILKLAKELSEFEGVEWVGVNYWVNTGVVNYPSPKIIVYGTSQEAMHAIVKKFGIMRKVGRYGEIEIDGKPGIRIYKDTPFIGCRYEEKSIWVEEQNGHYETRRELICPDTQRENTTRR